ncbi:MAG: glycosyltransferase [Myxococcaceae bacterium]|nr:glycosyltransferase [Myxococcaceae bacterium]
MTPAPPLLLDARYLERGVWAAGRAVVVCLSDGDDEFEAVDPGGSTLHCVRPERAWGPWRPRDFAGRALEKLVELRSLWQVRWSTVLARGEVPQWLVLAAEALALGGEVPELPTFPEARSVSVVMPTYGRVAEPIRALRSALAEAARAPVPVEVLAVVQSPGAAATIGAGLPLGKVRFVDSAPPGLTRARNEGLAQARGDLVVFIDDDVELDAGLVRAYVAASAASPSAVGFVGRVRSAHEGLERENPSRAVGHIRPSGWVDANFDSVGDARVTVQPHTPRGANMAFRREAVTALVGSRWFDEGLTGSAHREESTLALELQRRGACLAYVPGASLRHLEAEEGGCENRGPQRLEQRRNRAALEQRYLRRLYAPLGLAGKAMPVLSALRAVRHAEPGQRLAESLAQLAALPGLLR